MPGRPRESDAAAELTESHVQWPTAPGRLFAARPWTAHTIVAAAVLLLGLITTIIASETVRGSTSLGLFRPDEPVQERVVGTWLAGAAVGAITLTARRAWPLGITVVLTVLALVSLRTAGVLGVVGVCLAWALHAVAARHRARTAWITGAVVLGVVSVALWRWQDIGLAEILLWSDTYPLTDGGVPARQLAEPPFSAGRRSMSVMLLLALLVLGGVTGAGARTRRLHARDLVERYAALARERDTSAALARSAERARIAREMHDIVAHSVSVMVALSDGALSALDRAPDRSREALTELSRTGRDALDDLRGMLGSLRTDDTEPTAPTDTDLAAVVDRFRAAGLPLTTTGLETPLPPDTVLRLAVVRIVTEGLTNVLRHAPGTRSVGVALRRAGSSVEVEIADAGGTRPGADSGAHRGLIGMRERAELLGGRVEAGPAAGGGWRVRVSLPTSVPAGEDNT
ncbi:histidine kinase [Cryptosporangium japonicum]|uniref:histidine kinase n=1 Tax=Cryptosporangium japonicum TaxID=80872 RepID=A0ABN0UZT2_9ACTN